MSQAEKNRESCVIALLSWGAEVNVLDNNGNTPLHLASSPIVVQTLLVFGANTSLINNEVRQQLKYSYVLQELLHNLGFSGQNLGLSKLPYREPLIY